MRASGKILLKILAPLLTLCVVIYAIVYLDMVYSTDQEDRANIPSEDSAEIRVIKPDGDEDLPKKPPAQPISPAKDAKR